MTFSIYTESPEGSALNETDCLKSPPALGISAYMENPFLYSLMLRFSVSIPRSFQLIFFFAKYSSSALTFLSTPVRPVKSDVISHIPPDGIESPMTLHLVVNDVKESMVL